MAANYSFLFVYFEFLLLKNVDHLPRQRATRNAYFTIFEFYVGGKLRASCLLVLAALIAFENIWDNWQDSYRLEGSDSRLSGHR